jgi:hypothetical protein
VRLQVHGAIRSQAAHADPTSGSLPLDGPLRISRIGAGAQECPLYRSGGWCRSLIPTSNPPSRAARDRNGILGRSTPRGYPGSRYEVWHGLGPILGRRVAVADLHLFDGLPLQAHLDHVHPAARRPAEVRCRTAPLVTERAILAVLSLEVSGLRGEGSDAAMRGTSRCAEGTRLQAEGDNCSETMKVR